MKNKKSFFIIFLLSLLSLFIVFRFVDYYYFKEFEKLIALKDLGYTSSMIVFENKINIVLILFLLTTVFSLVIYYFLAKREKAFDKYLETIKLRLMAISKGDYKISIEEVESLGDLYDELYKLLLELREKSEKNYLDKIEIKKSLEDISHQLKTPLSSMEIMVELSKTNSSKEYLENIENELEKMNYLISSLLSLARLDVNQVNFHKEEISIKEILSTSLESLEPIIEEKNVKLELLGDDFTIFGDYKWLIEAFINILKNSIEHTGSQIIISCEKKNVYGEVIIQDNGPGFSKNALSKVFQRFYKEDENSPGVGIGLNLAKTILNHHTATIKAENNKGGVFIVKFY